MASQIRSWTRTLFFGMSILSLAISSCSSNETENQKPVYPVSGRVLVNDKPAEGAVVLFILADSPEGSLDPRPRGVADKNGDFKLTTYKSDDGAPAGEYRVTIKWPQDGEGDDRLKGRYDHQQTQLKVTVKAEPNQIPPFKLR